MIYATPRALRTALERRLLTTSQETSVSLDRLRRRVVFERVLDRLQTAEPGCWVVKGGMALEVRLHDRARLTKDLDLGMRDVVLDGADLHDRLIEILGTDPHADQFVVTVGPPEQLREDGGGHVTWRVKIEATLADKTFGRLQLDVSPRVHELTATEHIELSNSLAFAGIPSIVGEIIDIDRHAAEKLHAMSRDFGDRENSRVRDLIDVVLMLEHGLITSAGVAIAVRNVWDERNQTAPPAAFPDLPKSWRDRYERMAVDAALENATFPAALVLVRTLWTASSAVGDPPQ